MKRLEPELPEEKRILRELERQHGDMLPGSFAALEAISEQFKGSAPVTVYWLLADDWDRERPFVDGEDEVALNLNAPGTQTFNIPISMRHELQLRKFRRLSAFVTEQGKRLMKEYPVLEPTPFLLHEFVYRRHYQSMTWEIKASKQDECAVFAVRDIFFNLDHRRVYLLIETTDDDTLE